MLYKTKANCPWMVIDGTPGTREEHKHAVFSLNRVLIRPSEAVFQPWAHLMPSKTLVTKKSKLEIISVQRIDLRNSDNRGPEKQFITGKKQFRCFGSRRFHTERNSKIFLGMFLAPFSLTEN